MSANGNIFQRTSAENAGNIRDTMVPHPYPHPEGVFRTSLVSWECCEHGPAAIVTRRMNLEQSLRTSWFLTGMFGFWGLFEKCLLGTVKPYPRHRWGGIEGGMRLGVREGHPRPPRPPFRREGVQVRRGVQDLRGRPPRVELIFNVGVWIAFYD